MTQLQPPLHKQLVATISSQGQVTVPVQIRRLLNVTTSDKIAFVIEKKGVITLTQAIYPDIASLQGAAGSLKKPLKWKEVTRIAHEDRFKKKNK